MEEKLGDGSIVPTLKIYRYMKLRIRYLIPQRHTFITNLLQNGVCEEIVNGLDGHKQKTMSTTIYLKGGFGSKVLYKDGISKLRYEGIDFKSLRVDWKKLMHGREQNKKVKMWEGENLY